MADIYRKSALDKLSSPEQLDKAITIISPSFWIAAIGGGLIILVAFFWSIFGRLPVKVSANGMFMGKDGVHSVVAEADGIVSEVCVAEGEMVEEGQVIAKLDSKYLEEDLASLQERRDSVDVITFTSRNDKATEDNKQLIDIKAQVLTADSNLNSDQIMLNAKQSEYSKQSAATNSAKANKEQSQSQYMNAMKAYNDASNAYNNAQTDYTNAYNAYANFLKNMASPTDADMAQAAALEEDMNNKYSATNSAKITMQNAEIALKEAELDYSDANQNYSLELSNKKSMSSGVTQISAQVEAEMAANTNQKSAMEMQFDATKESILSQLDRQIDQLEDNIDTMTLKSRITGKVNGLNITEGNVVQKGVSICKVTATENDDSSGEGVICYVPVTEGKKLSKGMKVVVYPTTVNRQEYGHMEGEVVSISDYVVSSEEMMNQLGDSSLVQTFQSSGPVMKVVCDLDKDADTASGYYWSSKKGSSITIDEGTVIVADIVTEEKAPITMIIPLIKERLSVHRGTAEDN